MSTKATKEHDLRLRAQVEGKIAHLTPSVLNRIVRDEGLRTTEQIGYRSDFQDDAHSMNSR